jgi:N6-L-threonylcarbamoyladenine synthase
MPCFLSGIATAKAIAAALNVPTVECSHQDGHLMAAMYSAGATDTLLVGDFAAFHVSGGTTELLYVTPQENAFSVALLGQSLDLHAGQAVDRIGVMMGLKFPCGPALEEAAAACSARVPKPRINIKGYDCHLSGLENLAAKLYRDTQDVSLTAAYTLDFIAQTLCAMCDEVQRNTPELPILFAGGVMSNRRIQAAIAAKHRAYFATPQFSADNAAGVALLCRRALLK